MNGTPDTDMQILSDEAGFYLAYTVSQIWPGRVLYIPVDPDPHHPIALSIGEKNLRDLCQVFGGSSINIPRRLNIDQLLKRTSAIDMHYQGLGVKEIAAELFVTPETVRQWLRKILMAKD